MTGFCHPPIIYLIVQFLYTYIALSELLALGLLARELIVEINIATAAFIVLFYF